MPDEKSGQGQDQKGQDQNKHTNETAQETVQTTAAKLKVATDELKVKDDQITDLTEKLKQANDVIEGFERAPLISEIVSLSNIPIEDLSKEPTAELKTMLTTLNSAKVPTKSIRSQVGFDSQDRTPMGPLNNLFGKKLGEK